jgi:hypothetical protein
MSTQNINEHITFDDPPNFPGRYTDNGINSLSESDIRKPDVVIEISTETPYIYQRLGLPNRKLEIYRDKIARAVLKSKTEILHGHNDTIDKPAAEKLLKDIENPFYVFKSKDKKSLIGLYDIAFGKNQPIMASLRFQFDSNNIEVNFVTSAYGRSESKYEDWANSTNGLLIYADDIKKAEKLTLKLQLQIKANSSAYSSKILYKTDLVKELREEYQKNKKY